MNKRFLDRYFKTLSRKLLCDRKQKQRILSDLRLNAEHWMENHPEGDETAFLKAFGTPEQFAASYMEEMGLTETGKKVLLSRVRNIAAVLIGTVLLLFIIAVLSGTTELFAGKHTTTINPIEYVAQIGLPWEAALENLNLKPGQLDEVTIGLFKTPRTAPFYSYEFDVYLIMSKWGHYVQAFEYYLDNANPKEFIKLSDTLIALYGEPVHSGISQETFDALIQGGQADSITNQWIVRNYEEGELEKFRPAIKGRPFADDHYFNNAVIICNLKLIRDEAGSYRISLSFSLQEYSGSS